MLDPTCTLPGRGAYLCRGDHPDRPGAAGVGIDPRCLELAARRGGVARTLRRAVTLDLGDLAFDARRDPSTDTANS